jgi:uncharacterized membrane protein
MLRVKSATEPEERARAYARSFLLPSTSVARKTRACSWVAIGLCLVALFVLAGCSSRGSREDRALGSDNKALRSGLVAAYGFEEGSGTTTADASGHGLTGALQGTVWSRGKFGNALKFNGDEDWVTVEDAPALHLTSGMTLSAWVNPTSSPPIWQTVVMKESLGALDYVLYARSQNDDGPSAYFVSGGEDKGVIGAGDALPLHAWTYLAGTYDGSTLSIYKNGNLLKSESVSGTIDPSSQPLRFGGNSVWGEHFAGLIDEVRIYDHALSASEIAADMASAVTSPGPFLPLVMGETDVLPEDDSGNGNLLVAQRTSLQEPGTLESLSLYVSAPAGQLRLAVYDDTGPNGQPGAKKAETEQFTAAAGWNTANVVSPTTLQPGNYWLVYLPSDNNLHIPVNRSLGTYVAASFPFGSMPATYPASSESGSASWSFYATLLAQSGVCTTVTCNAPDACHDDGTCDRATGVCSNPDKSPPCQNVPQLNVNAAPHVVGGAVTGTWSGIGTRHRDDFVGLYRADVAAGPFDYVNFAYTCASRSIPQGPCTDTTPSGSTTFAIPLDAVPGGQYQLRYISWPGNIAAVSPTFEVGACGAPGVDCASLDAGSVTTVRRGSAVEVRWSGRNAPRSEDFIGLYATDVDRWHPSTLRFIDGASGTMWLDIPADVPLGTTYEARLSAGASYAPVAKSKSFDVAPCPIPGNECAGISVDEHEVAAGGSITIHWTDDIGAHPVDFIGLYRHGGELSSSKTFHYTGGTANGTMKLNIPVDTDPATDYEVRLVASGQWFTLLATSGPLAITARPTNGVGVANVNVSTIPPFAAYVGGGVSVNWSGVGAARAHDFVGLYAHADSKWNPRTGRYIGSAEMGMVGLAIPADLPAGDYEVRIASEDSYEPVAISALFPIAACPMSGDGCTHVSVAQTSVAAGHTLTVTWGGEVAPNADDWVAIFRVGTSAPSMPSFFRYTGGVAGGSVTLNLPTDLPPGRYDARLLAGPFLSVIARSPPPGVEVQADCATAGGACHPIDACQRPGTCNMATGTCANTPSPNGTLCDDGNACTRYDTCQSGICSGASVPGCAAKLAVEELPLLGGTHSAVNGINNSGIAVGWTDNPSSYQAVRWFPDGTVEALGASVGVPTQFANGINNAGAIVGYLGPQGSFRYSDAVGFETISPEAGSVPTAINESGSIAGFKNPTEPPYGIPKAFRYTNSQGLQWLGILPNGKWSWALGIDNQNNVVGDSDVSGSMPASFTGSHAFRYIDAENRLQDLNEYAPADWELREAVATNGDEIVGYGGHGGAIRAYRLTLSTRRVDDLGTLNGGASFAYAMNANGAISVSSCLDSSCTWYDGPWRAFIYTEQLGLVDLNAAIDPASGWTLIHATALNDNGDVVGLGTRNNGPKRAFRMHVPGLFPARIPRCTTGADCASGFCSEGVCCNTACTDQCSSCRLPGSFGTCSPKPNGEICSDDNRCTQADTCQNGACVPGSPVTCAALDQCHLDGTCDMATGTCSNPTKLDGTSCDDGSHVCVSGICRVPGCGDGFREQDEECESGTSPNNLMCTSTTCKVADFLPVQPLAQPPDSPPLRPDRSLGNGRHTAAGNVHTMGVAYGQHAPGSPAVKLQIMTSTGERAANADLGAGSTALLESNPVVAALPQDTFAVAWNDFGADGDELGVALRLVDASTPVPAPLHHANTTVRFSQHDPDILRVGNQVVVAWVDGSNAQTGPDVRYRIFDTALVPQSDELPLATTSDAEADVALAQFGDGWAAAWRAGRDGLETIQVKTGMTAWSVGPFLPGPADDKPALAEIDATHLLLVYTEGTDPVGTGVANVSGLRAALLDTAQPGQVPGMAVYPLAQAAGSAPVGLSHPNAVRAGNKVFMAWRSDAKPGDAAAEELWLKPVKLSTTHGLLDLSTVESAVPRQAEHRSGDQRHIALAELAANNQQSALVAAWDDLGSTFGPTEAQGDVVAQVVPLPIPPSTPACSGDLNSDRNNCGACGHDCLGGDCQGGRCQPFVLATGFQSPMGVVVVGMDVYTVDFGSAGVDASRVDGTLVRIAPDGTKTLLETGLGAPASLWYDEASSSFLIPEYYHYDIVSRPLRPGGTVSKLITEHVGFPLGIATNETSLFVSNSGDIAPEAIQQTVQRWSRPGLTSYALFRDFPNGPTQLDVDANYLYWTENVAGRVVRLPLGADFGASPSVEVLTTEVPAPRGIAVDGSTIYVSSYGPPGGLYRIGNSPGGAAALLATFPGIVDDIAVDAKAIYIAGRGSSSVWKMAK